MFAIAVFDLDGTLFDTLPDIYGALEFVLKKNGMKVPSENIAASFMGDGLKTFLGKAAALSGAKECPQPLLDDYFSYYGAHCTDKTRPYGGIEDLLEGLLLKGVTMGVASNKSEIFVRKIINHFGFDKFFAKISGGDTFSEKKPSPEPVIETIKSITPYYNPESCIMIGDSENDVASGGAAGIKTCWCRYGYGSGILSKADFTASSPFEIYDYIINNGNGE